MIGKPEWFTRRKWGGWGLYPATWQGWVYILVSVVLIFGTQLLGNNMLQLGGLVILAVILVLDTIDIMIRMKRDERELIHEAIAERNALWAIIFVLAAGIAFQAAQNIVLNQTVFVDPVIIVALVAGLIAKAASNYYLEKKY